MENCSIISTPVGNLKITVNGRNVTGIAYTEEKVLAGNDPLLKETERQLEEYFVGRRKTFDLPLDLKGTAFQKKVWQALLEIPYGETRSYSQIAEAAGNAKAVRAAGMANHVNPIVIAVPCHRVIGKNGELRGYGGGLEKKQFLLELETNTEEV
ncbi:MAG: methylated-DNA--[protein]-cysteine S-methyltransferase [Erysipelotrichaceae bacterium]|nr:methylated-DNA--[protein]-cysteine S-methyltransferase [Erysipelotrichaceae bacterium]